MRRLLSSPRMRRRIAWFGGGGLVAATIVVAALMMGNTGNHVDIKPRQDDPAVVVALPKTVRATAAERRAAYATAIRFINTAVRRKNVASSWDLVTPSMRSGYTRRSWATGDNSVIPFPAKEPRGAAYRLDYQYRNALGFIFLLFPEAKRKDMQPQTFFLDLKASGRGTNRRWLVDYFAPASATMSPPSPAEAAGDGAFPDLGAAAAGQGGKAELGTMWLLVPLGFLGLAALVPIVFALRGWYVARRVRRSYL
ncbi:MAG: hypothetical protein ABR583_15015 [Gaiellaceae bacterium]